MSENLLSRLEQSLRQSRAARMHLAARLRELEAEADSVRAELAEMDTLASQTEAAIYRLLSSVLASSNFSSGLPSDAELEAAKVAFVADFMTRPEFTTKYNGTTNQQYVDLLLSTAGITHLARDFWIAALTNGTRTRAQVLREIAESTQVFDKFNNEASVVMQYFGYLRREPDAAYLQWITHLNSTGDYRSMINGFMNSLEYRARFGQN